MTEPELATQNAKSTFSADEERFFEEGEALERDAPLLLDERRPRWRPRLLLAGCVGVALLAFLLAVGQRAPTAAVATVELVRVAESAPLPAPAPALPAPSAAPAPSAVAAERPAEKVKAKKQQRGKQAHRHHRTARR